MNKEEIMKEIEHIANCELYDTIGVKYLRLNIEKLFEENKQLKERIDKAIEFSNKNWGTWCTHHIEYMTELQNILKEASE